MTEVLEAPHIGEQIKQTYKKRFLTQMFLLNALYAAGLGLHTPTFSKKLSGKMKFNQAEIDVINEALGTDFKLD